MARPLGGRAGAVAAGLGALEPAERLAFVLVRYERLSFADTAEVLGASERQVRARADRALVALRSALGVSAGVLSASPSPLVAPEATQA